MTTTSILSTTALALGLALPAVASAQFVVTGQSGSSSFGASSSSVPAGTLTSTFTAANALGWVNTRTQFSGSVSETSVIGSGVLTLSAEYLDQSLSQSLPPGATIISSIPAGSTTGSLSFKLAQDTLVGISGWDIVALTDPQTDIGLFKVLANGSLSAVALPALNFVGLVTGGPHYGATYQGSGALTLGAGDYLMKVGLSHQASGITATGATLRAGLTLAAVVPEPATWLTMGLGMLALGGVRRRRRA